MNKHTIAKLQNKLGCIFFSQNILDDLFDSFTVHNSNSLGNVNGHVMLVKGCGEWKSLD